MKLLLWLLTLVFTQACMQNIVLVVYSLLHLLVLL
jgi:hypothetical protein